MSRFSKNKKRAHRYQPTRTLLNAQKHGNPRKAIRPVRKTFTDKPPYRLPVLPARPVTKRVWLGQRDLRNKNWLYLQRLSTGQRVLSCHQPDAFTWLTEELKHLAAVLLRGI